MATIDFLYISEVFMVRNTHRPHWVWRVLVIFLFLLIMFVKSDSRITKINYKLILKGYAIQEISQHYVLYYKDTFAGYYYELFDSTNNLVDQGCANTLPIKYLSDSIIEIRISGGTGVFRCKYYDVKNDKLSKDFNSPILVKGGCVIYYIYNSVFTVIAENMFSEDRYIEQRLYDFAEIANPIDGTVKVSLENMAVTLEYLSGKDFIPKSITIPIHFNN